MDWMNVLERAAWTFLEGFLVALPLGGGELDHAALMGALMAGLSALAVPDGFERYCTSEVLQRLQAFGAKHPLVRCRYQVDEGSLIYLQERIERLRDRTRV